MKSNRNSYNHPEYIGKKFGKLTIIGIDKSMTDLNGHKSTRFWCTCECGNKSFRVRPWAILKGRTKSCGCGQSNHRKSTGKTHGLSGTRIYYLWKAMLQRCENPNSKSYERYGGRGIKVCDRWHDFEHFYADMSELYFSLAKEIGEKQVSLERKDYNGNYDPENCTWIPIHAQGSNTRRVKKYWFEGEYKKIKEIAEIVGIEHNTLRSRLGKGDWSFDRCISFPVELNTVKHFGTTIDGRLYDNFERYCKEVGLKKAEVIEDLIIELLRKYELREDFYSK